MKNLQKLTVSVLSAAIVSAALTPSTIAAPAAKPQKITVTVDGRGFHPAAVNVAAGKPVQMTFVSKEGSCANAFSIPALKRTLSLQPGQKKMIQFTPKKGQTVAFACSMNMFKGKVTAK